jgi:hypothetical protein
MALRFAEAALLNFTTGHHQARLSHRLLLVVSLVVFLPAGHGCRNFLLGFSALARACLCFSGLFGAMRAG